MSATVSAHINKVIGKDVLWGSAIQNNTNRGLQEGNRIPRALVNQEIMSKRIDLLV